MTNEIDWQQCGVMIVGRILECAKKVTKLMIIRIIGWLQKIKKVRNEQIIGWHKLNRFSVYVWNR